MTEALLDKRGTKKQIITQQEQEIAALKTRIASLEREIAVLRGDRESRSSGDSGKSRGSRDPRDSRETETK